MHLSIRFKVLVSFLSMALVIVLLSSCLMYVKFRNINIRRVENDVKSIMQENKRNFNNMIKLIQKGSNYIAFNDFMVRVLLSEGEKEIEAAGNITAFTNGYKNMFDMLIGTVLDNYVLNFYVDKTLPLANKLSDGDVSVLNNLSVSIYSMRGLETNYMKSS